MEVTRNPMPEDEQITLIGMTAKEGKKVGVVVDNYKVARYMHKLRTRFPSLKVECKGSLFGRTVLITVEPTSD